MHEKADYTDTAYWEDRFRTAFLTPHVDRISACVRDRGGNLRAESVFQIDKEETERLRHRRNHPDARKVRELEVAMTLTIPFAIKHDDGGADRITYLSATEIDTGEPTVIMSEYSQRAAAMRVCDKLLPRLTSNLAVRVYKYLLGKKRRMPAADTYTIMCCAFQHRPHNTPRLVTLPSEAEGGND